MVINTTFYFKNIFVVAKVEEGVELIISSSLSTLNINI